MVPHSAKTEISLLCRLCVGSSPSHDNQSKAGKTREVHGFTLKLCINIHILFPLFFSGVCLSLTTVKTLFSVMLP